ncbi:hypothetical protein G6015_00770 [Dietzia sp. SLG510A3-40A3]|nr:hypothetical protein [Dietzia sp. SLG510A3-40A3]
MGTPSPDRRSGAAHTHGRTPITVPERRVGIPQDLPRDPTDCPHALHKHVDDRAPGAWTDVAGRGRFTAGRESSPRGRGGRREEYDDDEGPPPANRWRALEGA